MKVGTDGVLIGAWANFMGSHTICDIGSGTGLIALIAAQKNNNAKVIAIEIDPMAQKQASTNFANSPWSQSIKSICGDFNNVELNANPSHFVSNPPYFSQSALPQNKSRQIARHKTNLTLAQLFNTCTKLGAAEHKISLILPFSDFCNACQIASENKYENTRVTLVKPTVNKSAKRVLLEFTKSKTPLSCNTSELAIEIERHVYTPEYIALTRDFYLKM